MLLNLNQLILFNMKFIVDENIPFEVFLKLKKEGFDVISVSKNDQRLNDEEILSLALKENRTLITLDKDFGELVFRLKKKNAGIILLRIIPQSPTSISSKLFSTLKLKIDFNNSFCVIENNNVRVIPIK